jgi:hypothetical protein
MVNSEGPLATSHNIQYMLSNASVGAEKIVFIPEDDSPIDNQSNGNQSNGNQSNGNQSNDDPVVNNTDTNNDNPIVNNDTNNDDNSGIANSPSDDELDSELLNGNALIYTGISCLTILFVSMMFVMKIRKRRKAKRESMNLHNQYQNNQYR